jgi:SAM-dependent methyltransferase
MSGNVPSIPVAEALSLSFLQSVGLEKAKELAKKEGVAEKIETIVADLDDYDFGDSKWDAIVCIFCHLPPPLRSKVHSACVAALKPGGKVILEAYNPQQLEYKTGGPPALPMLFTKDMLEEDFKGLKVSRPTCLPVAWISSSRALLSPSAPPLFPPSPLPQNSHIPLSLVFPFPCFPSATLIVSSQSPVHLPLIVQFGCNFQVVTNQELVRDVVEGKFHTGKGAVVQLIAVKE